MQNLLVRGTNWIGDSIMTLPCLHELRRLWPQTRITLAVRPWVRDLFEGLDCVDALEVCDTEPRPWQRFSSNVEAMRRGGFDTALLLPNAAAPALQAAAAGIPARFGHARDLRGPLLTRAARRSRRLAGRHQCYHYLDLLHALGLSPVDYLADSEFRPDATLHWNDARRRRAAQTAVRFGLSPDAPLVGINAGAFYGAAKRWLPARFAQTADALAEAQGAEIVILGSSAERDLAAAVAAAMSRPSRVLAGETSLAELLDLISCLRLLITNDSGPMHLAAALETPVVALFGSTDAVATPPLGPLARVVRKEVACSPCLLRECPLDLRCFHRISVDEVVAAARDVLGRAGSARQK